LAHSPFEFRISNFDFPHDLPHHSGPTREPIDPVRFISNRSSGKMGYALAAAALAAGHEVTLISGPVCIGPPRGAQWCA